MIATIQVCRFQNVSSPIPKKRLPRNPPITAPTMPNSMVTMMPPGSSPGMRFDLGQANYSKRDFGSAEFEYHRALSFAEKKKDNRLQGKALHGLGIVARQAGDPDRARKFYDSSLQFLERCEDQHALGACWQSIGLLEQLRGHKSEAKTAYQNAWQLLREYGEGAAQDRVLAQVVRPLARIYLSEFRLVRGIGFFLRGMAIGRRIRRFEALRRFGLTDRPSGRGAQKSRSQALWRLSRRESRGRTGTRQCR
jgi:tetratricopeptide (TPR) repeat protein